MIALARMYQYGLGVKEDKQRAMSIYEKLAEKNNAYAQYQLATFYLDGITGERLPAKGKQLLENASKNGSQEAKKLLQSIEAQSKERLSFVEPLQLNHAPSIGDQQVEMVYFDAIREWNRGDEVLSRMILHRLLNKYPDYQPAKRAYEQLNPVLKSNKYS